LYDQLYLSVVNSALTADLGPYVSVSKQPEFAALVSRINASHVLVCGDPGAAAAPAGVRGPPAPSRGAGNFSGALAPRCFMIMASSGPHPAISGHDHDRRPECLNCKFRHKG